MDIGRAAVTGRVHAISIVCASRLHGAPLKYGCVKGPVCRRHRAMNGADMMLLDCPAYLDRHGGARCGLPAEVTYRYTVRSTDGPLESAKIRCPLGHWFNGPIASLIWHKEPGATAVPAGRARGAGIRPARPETSGDRKSVV